VLGSRPLPRPRPELRDRLVLLGSALLVVGLFLPWAKGCDGSGCTTVTAWWKPEGAVVALLAVTLAACVLIPMRTPLSRLGLAAALAVLLLVADGGGFPDPLARGGAPGSLVSYAGLSLVVVPIALRVRPAVERLLVLDVAALTACGAYL